MNRQNFPNPPSIQYVRSNDVQFHFFSKLSLDHLSIPFPYISGIVFKILKHLIKVVYIPQLCFQEILILEVVGGVWETFLNKALKWFWKLGNCLRAVVLKPDYLGGLKKKNPGLWILPQTNIYGNFDTKAQESVFLRVLGWLLCASRIENRCFQTTLKWLLKQLLKKAFRGIINFTSSVSLKVIKFK